MPKGGSPAVNKLLLLLPLSLGALEMKPWLGEVWEFEFTPSFTYSRYNNVQDGYPPFQHPSNDHVLALDLAVAPSAHWDMALEVEFADTPRQKMGYRSAAFQARVLWTDDIIGDPVSFTTGISLRGVSRHSLNDVSCPYHSNGNLELNAALGKEWGHSYEWSVRTFGFGGVGQANRGFPWARFFAMIEGNQRDTHRFGLFSAGYFGFGNKDRVPVDHFDGYASIHHQSVDVGASYGYHFEVWGTITLAYTRRVYAKSFPENVNFFTLAYSLPFSFL
jgi:hypothetical protein